jgi:DNA repair protein RadC
MENKRLIITDWAEEDRPREKLMQKGTASLSDAELLAILIGSGNTEETAVELSRRIMKRAQGNLHELGKFSIDELIKNFKGIGEAKAITIVAAMELGRRRKLTESIVKKQITSSTDVFDIFHPILSDLPHEEFWLLILNRANKLVEQVKISQGGVSGTVVDARIILKNAIDKLASSVALCHNHPSGNKNPSNEDITITRKLKTAFETVDIELIDHVIISGNSYYSFADEGII